MVVVHGTIKHGDVGLNYEVDLQVNSIYQDDMPIPESTELIINVINKKYNTNFPLSSRLNPLKIKKDK